MAQNSFDINGFWNNELLVNSGLTFFDINSAGSTNNIRDWLFSMNYGTEFSYKTNSYLNYILVAKAFENHRLTLRYSPGFQKEFLFSTGQSIVFGDSTAQSLKADYVYKEIFGAAYSYKFDEKLSAGVNIRFLNQSFTQEAIKPVFSDTNYLVIDTENDDLDLWKADLSFSYKFSRNLSFWISSINLLTSNNQPRYEYNRNFTLKSEKAFATGFFFAPFRNTSLNILYEYENSFTVGIIQMFELGNNKIGLSLSANHDKNQTPYINSISPSITYSSKLFDVAISGNKYINNRKNIFSFQEFAENGISNVYHNQFSNDNVNLTFSFKLNTKFEQTIKVIDVEIKQDIFPALTEEYLDKPFAIAKVVNISDKVLTIKPAIKISEINKDIIQLGSFQINPLDTAEVPVYAFIPENIKIDKTSLSYADIYFYTISNEPEDVVQKPVLINGMNSWDGVVKNLRYFIKKDLTFSQNYAKQILSEYKSELDTVPLILSDFYRAKIIFNQIVKNLTYVSDPRIKWDFVQYPSETIKLKGGDCDDLSVLYSSLLESIGIETALVDYRARNDIRHVNILVNTKLSPQQADLITENDTKYFIRKNEFGIDELWIAIEITSLTDFETAWNLGSEIFNDEAFNKMGLVKGNVQIIDVY